MNAKIIVIVSSLVVLAFFIGFVISVLQNHESLEIDSQNDLTQIVNNLTREISTSQKYLRIGDISTLVGPDHDMELITLFPNDMNGYSFGINNTTNSKKYSYEFENGTRIFKEINNNGTLLKEIKIFDVPEKMIVVLLK